MQSSATLAEHEDPALFGHPDEHLKRYGIAMERGQVIRKPCGLPTFVRLLGGALAKPL